MIYLPTATQPGHLTFQNIKLKEVFTEIMFHISSYNLHLEFWHVIVLNETFITASWFWNLNLTHLYSLKTSENIWFSDVFRGYRNGTLDISLKSAYGELCQDVNEITEI